MTEPTGDLQQRCAECIEWRKTGELRQGALRVYAEKHWQGHHDSLQMAERDTAVEAMRWIAKWGTPPAVAGEPVAWLDPWTGAKATTDYDAYGKHGIPLYTAPQLAPAQRCCHTEKQKDP